MSTSPQPNVVPFKTKTTVFVVSGLPRSGTSMMMQILEAGGMPVLADERRPADRDNPNGYYEYEPVKRLKNDNRWLAHAGDKVVKVVSHLVPYLPPDFDYRVLFMRRPLQEVLASQNTMLRRLGMHQNNISDQEIGMLFEKEMRHVDNWMSRQPNFEVLFVDYHDVVGDPVLSAAQINNFVGPERGLDEFAMARAVDPALHRQR